MRITQNKLKRLVICLFIILVVEIVFVSMSVYNYEEDIQTEEQEIRILSNEIDKIMYFDPETTTLSKEDIEINYLMDKFELRYELRDYFTQLCMIYNIDSKIALSLCRIESWCGNHKGYNSKSIDRMYYTNGVACWDLGMMQMTTYYSEEWRTKYYNPELILSLGYVRYDFTLEDDYISLQVGLSYFSYLYKRLGSYDLAIKAYNCGIGNVLNGNIPNITYKYAHAIMNNWKYRERKGYI